MGNLYPLNSHKLFALVQYLMSVCRSAENFCLQLRQDLVGVASDLFPAWHTIAFAYTRVCSPARRLSADPECCSCVD